MTPGARRTATAAAVLALLGLHAGLAVSSMIRKSVTIDEITYIAAGSYHLETGDFHLNQTNPPLMKMLAALPLKALGAELPRIEGTPREWSLVDQWKFARRFLYHNRVDADRMLFAARLPFVALSLVLGLGVFAWSRRLYGTPAGLFSLGLYCVSTTMLAHARLATQDLGLSALLFACSYAFWRSVRSAKLSWVLLCGAAFGLAALAKTPAFFALPAFAGYGLWCALRDEAPPTGEGGSFARLPLPAGRGGRLLTLGAMGAVAGSVALLVLNAGYGFQGTFTSLNELLPRTGGEPSGGLAFVGALPLPLPSAYVEGLLFQRSLGGFAGNVFFAGERYPDGLWYLTLASLGIKLPLAFLALIAFTGVDLVRRAAAWECERLLLLVVLAFLATLSYLSNMGGAVRYVLPIFPCLFVLAGSVVDRERATQRWRQAFAGASLLGCAVAAFGIHPDYLASFNGLVGGPDRGYRYLADSNLDWGQDLKGLKRWMDEHGVDRIHLAYFGSADADYYGIRYEYLPSVGLAPKGPGQYWWYEMDSPAKRRLDPRPTGWIAVSANLLARPQWLSDRFGDTYDWLLEYEPVDEVGHSILIYRIEP